MSGGGRRVSRILFNLLVFGLCIGVGLQLLRSRPEAERRNPKPLVPTVEVMTVKRSDFRVHVPSRGTVLPRTQSLLAAEVSGEVEWVSPHFQVGGFFREGERLLRIDSTRYRLARAHAEATVQGILARIDKLDVEMESLGKKIQIEKRRLTLAEKERRRHARLRSEGTVSASTADQSERVVLEHQAAMQNLEGSLLSLKADRKVLASELAVERLRLTQAELDLEHTWIEAPFHGRVLEKQTDRGQWVSQGGTLATLYAIDFAEVRLPISSRQETFLDLPDPVKRESGTSPLRVELSGRFGDEDRTWEAWIHRTEGALDRRTRRLFLVARLKDPQGMETARSAPLRMGQFVRARIEGRLLEDVYVLPRSALGGDYEVMVVSPGNLIQRRRVQVIWSENEWVVVQDGLDPSERISLTPLPYAPDGSRVRVQGEGEVGSDQGPMGRTGQDAARRTHRREWMTCMA